MRVTIDLGKAVPLWGNANAVYDWLGVPPTRTKEWAEAGLIYSAKTTTERQAGRLYRMVGEGSVDELLERMAKEQRAAKLAGQEQEDGQD